MSQEQAMSAEETPASSSPKQRILPKLSFWQIWNMSFGFLGIQFGFGLQMANMSRIFQKLGVEEHDIAGLWIAAPLTGFIVQPIIGHLSDRTWTKFGRRKPFFLIGAILSSIALILMPNSPTWWIAAGLLWVLDASINISMEPFRALVGDKLPESQRTIGFTVQSFLISAGAIVASFLPSIFAWIGIDSGDSSGLGNEVIYSFYIGAVVFIAAIIITLVTTKEDPPEDMEAFEKMKKESAGFVAGFKEIMGDFAKMPKTMKQLGFVQFFTWFALFCMWVYSTPAITSHVFGIANAEAEGYNEAANIVGECFGIYNFAAFAMAMILVGLGYLNIQRRFIHAGALLCGAIGLTSTYFATDTSSLYISFIGVGIAWASILAIPYAMLSAALPPAKMGIYMGIFNFFIVTPQVIASLGGIEAMKNLIFGEESIYALVLGGISMGIAAVSVLFVKEVKAAPGAGLAGGGGH